MSIYSCSFLYSMIFGQFPLVKIYQIISFLVGEHIDFDDKQWADIHVIAGALKWYFRELPEPVIPSTSFDEFVNGISK